MLCISASLDLETVLREVVENARTLTGARYGAITMIDETGAPKNFVTSGLTEGVHVGNFYIVNIADKWPSCRQSEPPRVSTHSTSGVPISPAHRCSRRAAVRRPESFHRYRDLGHCNERKEALETAGRNEMGAFMV